jgi:diphthamide biosynthesis enzyme Dph1/Dph2-like protein
MLKRRYYLMQRARDALIVGILAGTMAAAGYTEALTRENSYSIHLRNLHTKY